MSKKILFLYCIITFLICIAISEFAIYKIAEHNYNSFNDSFKIKRPSLKYSLKMTPTDVFYNLHQNELRPPVGLSYTKKPVVLFGCSFVYGFKLNENQTFSYKLSKLTKRPVYNRGMCGGGIQHMYYQLARSDFYKQINGEPEYIIFTYIPQFHTPRLYEYTFLLSDNTLYLRYAQNKKDKNGNLVQLSTGIPKFINGLYTVKGIYKLLVNNYYLKQDLQYHNAFIQDLLSAAMEKGKQHYKNTKYVVLCYETGDNQELTCNKSKDLFKELEKDGFIVLNTKDLIGRDLNLPQDKISETDTHPTEAAWDLIVPALSKKLSL